MREYYDAFDTIIIDTNAFDAKKNDFIGLFDNILPEFFATIQRLNLKLLSHPILEGENLRHIANGDFMSKPGNAVTSLNKYKSYLELVGFEVDKAIEALQNLNLCKKEEEAYHALYQNSIMLPYAKPEVVFQKYFSNKPPFADTSNKKAEFPDAFVLGALEDYLILNPNEKVLVVTKDGDWTTTLKESEYKNVRITETIGTALRLLYDYETKLSKTFDAVYSDMVSYTSNHALESIWFELNDYLCDDEIDVRRIKIDCYRDDIVPLLVRDNELILQVELTLFVDGTTTIIDYDNSVWDHEDKCFLFTSFAVMDFKNARGKVTAELHIKTEKNQNPVLSNVKFIAPHGVSLTIDNEQTHFTNVSFEADAKANQMDALEEFYRH